MSLDGATLATQLAARPGIQSTRYVSRDEALATFRAESDLGGALDVLESNPLPGAIVIAPKRATTGQERMQARCGGRCTYRRRTSGGVSDTHSLAGGRQHDPA